MKTGLKLGIVALSLVAMATTIYTQTVKADTSAEVKVTIIEGLNDCNAMSGYEWTGINASIDETELTGITNSLYCSFLKDTGGNLTFTLTDLIGSTTTRTLSGSQFSISMDDGVFTGTLAQGSSDSWDPYDGGGTLYTKNQHEVGEFTKEITISGVVPAGTAVDTYVGQLNIVVPN